MAFHESESYLFPSELISNANFGENLICRPLNLLDYHKGFCENLEQLTKVGEYTFDKFEQFFNSIKQTKSTYFIIVIEDIKTSKIVGSGSIIIEMKFTHGCSKVGHIEDIVINESQRGKNLGKMLIEELKMIGTIQGCYKIILDCLEKNIKFYEKCGFKSKEIEMAYYIPQDKFISPKL